MRIWSVRSTTLKFTLVLALSVVAVATLVIFVPSAADAAVASGISYSGVETNADRIAFISQFGWTVDETPVEEVEVTVPKEFDTVYAEYNEIQIAQGLNLSKYRGKSVAKYKYAVKNYENYDGDVYITLLVYKNKIIGGDLCSADANGFVCGFSGERS